MKLLSIKEAKQAIKDQENTILNRITETNKLFTLEAKRLDELRLSTEKEKQIILSKFNLEIEQIRKIKDSISEEIKIIQDKQKHETELLLKEREQLVIFQQSLSARENKYQQELSKLTNDQKWVGDKVSELDNREKLIVIREEEIERDFNILHDKQTVYIQEFKSFMGAKERFENILIVLNKDIDQKKIEIIKDREDITQEMKVINKLREQVSNERKTLETRQEDFKIRKKEFDNKFEASRDIIREARGLIKSNNF